jgi:hypothetical protein
MSMLTTAAAALQVNAPYACATKKPALNPSKHFAQTSTIVSPVGTHTSCVLTHTTDLGGAVH